MAMTAAEEWMRAGRNEGRVETLCRLLELKFGEVSSEHQARLRDANEEQLKRYTVRILTAQAIEEVFAEPA